MSSVKSWLMPPVEIEGKSLKGSAMIVETVRSSEEGAGSSGTNRLVA